MIHMPLMNSRMLLVANWWDRINELNRSFMLEKIITPPPHYSMRPSTTLYALWMNGMTYLHIGWYRVISADHKSKWQFRTTWWRHEIETFSALLLLFEENPPVTSGFPSQRPVTRNFHVFFDLRLNKRLNKLSRRRLFETSLLPLWHHCNE